MKFKVKGTSYNNENGESRQKIIQNVIDTYINNEEIGKEELYDGNTNKDIKDYDLKVCIYEGIYFPANFKKNKYKDEDCIEVYLINYYKSKKKVGYIPKELVNIIWKDVDEEAEIPVKILGGKYKEYDMLEDEVIINDTGLYGIEIEYITEEEKRKMQEETNKKEKNAKLKKQKEKNNKIIELVICIILGIFGGHKFYEGKIKLGIIYLFTGGIFGIGWLIDIIKILIELKDMKAL